jgi:hypothetical protein
MEIKRKTRFLASTARWGQGQTIYDHEPTEGRHWRKRAEDEKIENNLRAWYELRAELAAIQDELIRIDTVAVREVRRLRAAQEVKA